MEKERLDGHETNPFVAREQESTRMEQPSGGCNNDFFLNFPH